MDTHDPDAPLPWITAVWWTLVGSGIIYLMVGLAAGPLLALREAQESGEPLLAVLFGVIFFVGCGGFAAVNFVAAWGLDRRAKWAWIVALLVGGMYAASACCLFGGVILYGLLREDARIAFGISQPRPSAEPEAKG